MTARERDATARQVLAALGIDDVELRPLGEGLASEAWRVGAGAREPRPVQGKLADPGLDGADEDADDEAFLIETLSRMAIR